MREPTARASAHARAPARRPWPRRTCGRGRASRARARGTRSGQGQRGAEASARAGIAAGARRATAAALLARGRHRALRGLRTRERARTRHIARTRHRALGPAPARARAAAGHIARTAAAPDLVAAARGSRALDLARRRGAADDQVRAGAIAAHHAARDVRCALHVGRVTAIAHAAIDHADPGGVARALRAPELAPRDRRRVPRLDIGRAIGGERIIAGLVPGQGAPAIAAVLAAGAIGDRRTLHRAVSNARVVAASDRGQLDDDQRCKQPLDEHRHRACT